MRIMLRLRGCWMSITLFCSVGPQRYHNFYLNTLTRRLRCIIGRSIRCWRHGSGHQFR